MEDLTFLPAGAIAELICRKDVSALEVVDAHLERIAIANEGLNAVVRVVADEARAQAAAADAGDVTGPLHGVPFTVKDWIDADATVVARLRAAGAILLGRTNVGHDHPVFGPTRNPYDLRRTAGASSSGEGAAIAAGASPLGLGSDSGGSIRQPAHCCGIAGLRPSSGRVPLTGHSPRINPLADPRTVIGPMARTVTDLALALPIICGPDGKDASTVPVPLDDPGRVDVAGLRVAFYTDDGVATPTTETVDAVAAVAGALERSGLAVEERRPPGLGESVEITEAYWARPESESWDEWVPDQEVRLSSDEVEQSLFFWDRFRRRMLGFMASHDVILTPAAPHPAPPHPAREGGFSYLLPFSLTGWPCVVVRAGTSSDGMPIGVQVVAGPWRDDVALALAGAVEGISGGWQRPGL